MTTPEASAPVTWDHARFERNLDALKTLQPGLARRLAELELPETVEPVTGRDGTPTFRLVDAAGRRRWLGGSSMPSISAPAAVEHFNLEGANALLPLLGTGFEANLLCRRTGRHAAVFAWDADPISVKLALYTTELDEHLRSGRLILLTFESIEQLLPEFMDEHPGYDFPDRLLRHPSIATEDFDRFRTASENATAEVIDRQLKAARAIAAELGAGQGGERGEHPRVALLSSDPRPGPMAVVDQLERAISGLGCPLRTMAPSAPTHCHNLARLIAIRDHRPDLVLFLNSCVGRLRDFVPPSIKVASWFWHDSLPGAATAEGYGPEHQMFATNPEGCRQLCDAGVAAERVHLLEVGVDSSIYKPVDVDSARRAEFACDVAILADAVESSAAVVGIRHPSQVAMWDKIRELTARRAHEYTSAMAARIVTDAARNLGIPAPSNEVRDKYVRLIQHGVAGTAVTRAVAVDLSRKGLAVKLWGGGWQSDQAIRPLLVGATPKGAQANVIYQSAAAVVFPNFDRMSARAILDVTAAGGQAIFRTPETSLKTMHPQVAEVLELLPKYQSFAELGPLLRETRAVDGRWAAKFAEARRVVAERHTLGCRVRKIGQVCLGAM